MEKKDDLLKIRKNLNIKLIGEEIYQTLRYAIIHNILESGFRLEEDSLSEIFNISRTPVRDAIKRLEYEDFIIHDVKRGFLVRSFTMSECFEIMEAMEYLRQITTLTVAPNISPLYIVRLNHSIKLSREAYERGDEDMVAILDEFHEIIAQSLNNNALMQLYNSLSLKCQFAISRFDPISIDPVSMDEHQAIADALAIHDKDKAWALEMAHSQKALVNKAKRFIK